MWLSILLHQKKNRKLLSQITILVLFFTLQVIRKPEMSVVCYRDVHGTKSKMELMHITKWFF